MQSEMKISISLQSRHLKQRRPVQIGLHLNVYKKKSDLLQTDGDEMEGCYSVMHFKYASNMYQ